MQMKPSVPSAFRPEDLLLSPGWNTKRKRRQPISEPLSWCRLMGPPEMERLTRYLRASHDQAQPTPGAFGDLA